MNSIILTQSQRSVLKAIHENGLIFDHTTGEFTLDVMDYPTLSMVYSHLSHDKAGNLVQFRVKPEVVDFMQKHQIIG